MKKLSAALVAAFLLIVIAVPAAQASTNVHVRIEGKTETLFEGTLPVDVHKIQSSSGTEPEDCNGPPGTLEPSATATLAAVEAMASIGESFNSEFGVGFITRFGPDEQDEAAGAFWGVLANNFFLNQSGCEERVQEDDEVEWIFNAFSERPRLALYPTAAHYVEGPVPTTAIAHVGEPFAVEVVDIAGEEGDPVPDHPSRFNTSPYAGAEVAPVATNAKGFQRVETSSPATVTTGADGKATIVFTEPGIHRIKATEGAPGAETAVRSNGLTVCVPAKAGDCGELIGDPGPPSSGGSGGGGPAATPTAAPVAPRARAQISRPALDRSKLDQGKVTVSWKVLTAGPGITRWKLSSKTLGRKGAKFVARAHGVHQTRAAVRLPRGATYALRLTLTDASGVTTTKGLGKVVVPA
jgi:hypothetical protein